MARWDDSAMLWVETCCNCGVIFGMANEIYRVAKQRREKSSFYCPNGHQQHYATGETEADKLRRERDRLKQDRAYWEDSNKRLQDALDRASRSASAYKGQVTRIKKRVSHGVCPCCNRTFDNLGRHMASKHPEYEGQEEPAE